MQADEEKALKGVDVQENPPQQQTWTSCCFTCDRSVVLYVTKTFITVSIMAFAMFRITSNDDKCKEQSFEHGLIGMIAGSFIEQGHQRMLLIKDK